MRVPGLHRGQSDQHGGCVPPAPAKRTVPAAPERVLFREGSMSAIVRRDGRTPPGSRTASRMKGDRRNPGGPVGAIVRSTMGVSCEGRPEHGIEPKPGVGRAHSSGEVPEGNEGAEGRGLLEAEVAEGAGTDSNASASRATASVALCGSSWTLRILRGDQ